MNSASTITSKVALDGLDDDEGSFIEQLASSSNAGFHLLRTTRELAG